MRRADDRGSVLILSLGVVVLVVAVLLVAADIATLSLRRREAEQTADGAARAAVQALDLGAYYRGVTGSRLPVDPVQARRFAQRYVESPWRISRFEVAADAVTVTVVTDVPLMSGLMVRPDAEVSGTGSARLQHLR